MLRLAPYFPPSSRSGSAVKLLPKTSFHEERKTPHPSVTPPVSKIPAKQRAGDELVVGAIDSRPVAITRAALRCGVLTSISGGGAGFVPDGPRTPRGSGRLKTRLVFGRIYEGPENPLAGVGVAYLTCPSVNDGHEIRDCGQVHLDRARQRMPVAMPATR